MSNPVKSPKGEGKGFVKGLFQLFTKQNLTPASSNRSSRRTIGTTNRPLDNSTSGYAILMLNNLTY